MKSKRRYVSKSKRHYKIKSKRRYKIKSKSGRRKSIRRIKSRSRRRIKSKSRRRIKSNSRRSIKNRSRSKILYINSLRNLFVDGGGIENKPVKYKIIKLETCPYCKNAKKLIEDKGFSLDYKDNLTHEEEEIIKKTVGEYNYFPKIFEYNETTKQYDFIGGYDKLKQKFKE